MDLYCKNGRFNVELKHSNCIEITANLFLFTRKDKQTMVEQTVLYNYGKLNLLKYNEITLFLLFIHNSRRQIEHFDNIFLEIFSFKYKCPYKYRRKHTAIVRNYFAVYVVEFLFCKNGSDKDMKYVSLFLLWKRSL